MFLTTEYQTTHASHRACVLSYIRNNLGKFLSFMKCLVNSQQVRLRKNFSNMEIKFKKEMTVLLFHTLCNNQP